MSQRSGIRLPRARRPDELIIEPVGDEVLVFDNNRSQAHRLNKSAALVWRLCNGKTRVETAVEALRAAGLPADPKVVEVAIAGLTRAKLVEPMVDWSQVRFRSRRTLLKQLGLMAGVAVALPVVQSIVAPSVAHAMSFTCVGINQPCTPAGGAFPCCAPLTCNPGPGGPTCGP